MKETRAWRNRHPPPTSATKPCVHHPQPGRIRQQKGILAQRRGILRIYRQLLVVEGARNGVGPGIENLHGRERRRRDARCSPPPDGPSRRGETGAATWRSPEAASPRPQVELIGVRAPQSGIDRGNEAPKSPHQRPALPRLPEPVRVLVAPLKLKSAEAGGVSEIQVAPCERCIRARVTRAQRQPREGSERKPNSPRQAVPARFHLRAGWTRARNPHAAPASAASHGAIAMVS